MTSRQEGPTDMMRRFHRDESGSVFVLVALGFLVIMGVAALAVDMGNAYVMENNLQTTADSAALAAASELPDVSNVTAVAVAYATKNMATGHFGDVVTAGDVATGNWSDDSRTFTAAGTPTNAVRVVARMSEDNDNAAPTFFGRLFGKDSIDITASAVATGSLNRCVYVLDNNDMGALTVTGGAQVEMDCGVVVNSDDADAINQVGSSCLNTQSIEVVGGYSMDCTNADMHTGTDPTADPLAALPPPDWFACETSSHMNINGTQTLSPGSYCHNLSIQAGANVTLESGIYIFGYSSFSVAAGATLTGDNVMIYFSEFGNPNTSFSIAGSANVELTAPDSGPYEGILFYSDRNGNSNITHNFVGGSTMDLTGIIYAPNQALQFAGGADFTGSCVTIVSRTLTFNGDSNISASAVCPDGLAPLGSNLRLVQ